MLKGPEYYRQFGSLTFTDNIKNFDEHRNFQNLEVELRNPKSHNFVIDYGDDEAWCGFNLDGNSISKLLKSERPAELNTRWINIWLPHEQKDTLKAIARYYDFSPRLLGIMCTDPVKKKRKTAGHARSHNPFHRVYHHDHHHHQKVMLEEDIGLADIDPPTTNVPYSGARGMGINDINHWTIVDEVWHWSSVDWGRRYICLGYNALYNVHGEQTQVSDAENDGTTNVDLPHGKRVWSWLLLCDDHTVIMIHEDPFPQSTVLNSTEQATLMAVRRNITNVFRQLSKAYDSSAAPAISILPLRKRLGDSEEETAHRSSDLPGLLFHCLFDDWYNSYSIVARREHQYAAELNKLREDMLTKAELAHVDRLHHIGRQLAVLKRVYRSYEVLIDRVLEKREASLASLKNSHIVSGMDNGSGMGSGRESMMNSMSIAGQTQGLVREEESMIGVSLSSAARVRFERLKWRIRLYALSEIDECLDLKESLVMMVCPPTPMALRIELIIVEQNFNLIAIKESYAVERLTRVTLLLAKVTILFMPISLLTGIFSMQLTDYTFRWGSYWVCFGVIFALSVLGLVWFSFMTSTLEGKMLYRPLTRKILDVSKRLWQSRKKVS